jgi:O-antigen/teichoic acid export membrane protein
VPRRGSRTGFHAARFGRALALLRRHVAAKASVDDHMREVIRGASTALLLKIVGGLLTFCFYVAIGRLLGARQAGTYFLALTVITVAAVVGRAGLDGTLLRLIAGNAALADWAAVKGAFEKGITIALAVSSVATVVTMALAPWLAEALFSTPELTRLIRWMALSVVPLALVTLVARAVQGIRRIADATLINDVAVPALSLVGFGILVPGWGVLGAVAAYTLAAFAALPIGLWLWRRATPQLNGVIGNISTERVLQSSMPLLWVSCLQMIMLWSSTVALGTWATSVDVGLFSAANRTATLISLILWAVNSIAAPKFAALHRQGDMVTLGRLARNSAKLMALLAAPALGICLVAPGRVMGLFGPEFIPGGHVLAILAAGQFVNVVTGSVGFLLIMCGYERTYRNIFLLCALISVALNIVLVPSMGATGAAIATAVIAALQNLIAATAVWRKLGIMTIPFLWPKPETV